jgi:Protein of unknown function (DUF1570)
MSMRLWLPLVLCLSLGLALVLVAAEPPGADDWKYDVIHRLRGVPLQGLVVEQNSTHVVIKCITRRPGSPTLVFTEYVPRREIESLALLSDADRRVLESRLETLKHDREQLAAQLRSLDPSEKGLALSIEKLDLRPTPWPPNEKLSALSYQSGHFRLVSSARSGLTQLAAIHLEQIYAAYGRALKPRTTTAKPTTILLTGSLTDYQTVARARHLDIFNPAFYDPSRNEVVCGSDLERLSEEREKVRKHHTELRAEIKERRAELHRIYRGRIPAELLDPLTAAEKRITLSEQRNAEVFARHRRRLFTRLYHEAFHAYVGNYVYPEGDGPLPRWLNEGLAQIFETAIVEVGELRVGNADAERVQALRKAMSADTLLPLADLLRAEPERFFVTLPSENQVSDRHYLGSWALAYYITFDRQLLGTKQLDDYVKARHRGTDPLVAFRDLVGKPLDEFEKEYLDFLKRLRPNGSVVR